MFRSSAGSQQQQQQQQQEEEPNVRHNSHWLSDGKESRYVGYYDAASLYPSSSECVFLFVTARGWVWLGVGCEVSLSLPPLVRAAPRSWAAPTKYSRPLEREA